MCAAYSGNLFDSNGPYKFAQAVGAIPDAMGRVVASFVQLDQKATTALSNISDQMSKIEAGSTRIGGKAARWGGAPGTPNTGDVGGQQGDTTNVGGDHTSTGYQRQTTLPTGGQPQGMTRTQGAMAVGAAAAGWAGAFQASSLGGRQQA